MKGISKQKQLYKGKPVKSLVEGLTKTGGRNNKGRISVRILVPAKQMGCLDCNFVFLCRFCFFTCFAFFS